MNLGELSVTLGAVMNRFNADMDAAKAKLIGVSKKMTQLVLDAGKLAAGAVAAGAAIALHITKTSADAARELQILSDLSGTTFVEFQRQAEAARRVGIEQEKLADIFKDAQDRVGDFLTTGGGPMLDFFEQIAPRIGVTANEFRNLSGPEVLQKYVDSLQRANVSQDQFVFFMEAMASDSSQLIPLLRDQGAELAVIADEAEKAGRILSDIEVEQLLAAEDAFFKIGQQIEAVKNQLAVVLAPFIVEISNRLQDLTADSEGFRDAMSEASERGIRGMSKVADVIHGLQVVLKGAQLIGYAFGAAMVSVGEIALTAVAKVTDTVTDLVNDTIDSLNKLPGVDIARLDPFSGSPFYDGFKGMANDMRNRVGELRGELHEMAMQPMPSTQVEGFLQAVRENAAKAADETNRARRELREMPGVVGGGVDRVDPADEEKARRERERMAARLDALREFTMSEVELEAAAHADRLEELEKFHEDGLVLDEEYMALREALEQEYADRLAAIREASATDLERFQAASWQAQVGIVSGALAQMTAGVAQHSRKMFELNKAAGIANAIIATYEGVTKALAAYPPPISFAMAAAQAAAGFAQVNAIKSAQFGGGGGAAPSLAGGTAGTPVSNVGGAGGAGGGGQVITLNGLDPASLYTGKAVRGLIESIQDALDDGAKLVIT